jgi:UPF0042 nucleotide-binding protein
MTETPVTRLVLVTGLSGAGRTTALKQLEDLGYEAIDNLPLSLIGRLLSPLTGDSAGHAIAVAVDFRTRDFSVAAFDAAVAGLRAKSGISMSVLFLDCESETLARRFTETRRRHPLADDRPVVDGIEHERRLLDPVRERADLVIDSSQLTGRELTRLLAGHFGLDDGTEEMMVSVISFSYRSGLPREADLVFDVRFLANPHYEEELRPLDGRDARVAQFVAADPAYDTFMDDLTGMLSHLFPLYLREGKSYLTIAIGCTGGQHRSVAVAENLTQDLQEGGHNVLVKHRDSPVAPRV